MRRSPKIIQESNLFLYEAVPQNPAETASKEEYIRRLAEYLKDPAFRQIEGFPIATDEDILALSDPPYYTACPNPFLDEIVKNWRHERLETRKVLGLPDDTGAGLGIKYRREPFAADVSEGKNDPIYNVHSYHTKVPHKAIMRYILHYTDPGDIVFDGFCGTGMTGVAAQLCGDKKAVENLGYKVEEDGTILDENGKFFSRLGTRQAVLNDLSPAATFIAYNYNTPIDIRAFERDTKRILMEVEKECSWMYETWHPNSDFENKIKGKTLYTVWSDLLCCPICGFEMTFWESAVDKENYQVKEKWNCRSCGSLLSKNADIMSGAIKSEKVWEVYYDENFRKASKRIKRIPVLISYRVNTKRYLKEPDDYDKWLFNKIEETRIPYLYPTNELKPGDKTSDPFNAGIRNVNDFYTKRNIWVFASLSNKFGETKHYGSFVSLLNILTRMYRFRSQNNSLGAGGGPMNGTLYVPSLSKEIPVLKSYSEHIDKNKRLATILKKIKPNAISTSSHSTLSLQPDQSLDYIFTDPPFGGNIMYSELNFITESWLKVFTCNSHEAVMNKTQKKRIRDYQDLMLQSFKEAYRILKHRHWITIEFHNSMNLVWIAIQEALIGAGFVIADVRTLDKKQGAFNQVNASGAVKRDLVISAYKPSEVFEKDFLNSGGTEAGAWDFIRQHLEQLPLPALHETRLEAQAERMPYLLYDRMLAFHLVRGLTIPLSASEFYAGLAGRYLSRDGMCFTSAQAADYDRLRLKADRVEQLALFITDEQSAIQWLRQELDPISGRGPETYGDLQPHFIQQLHQEKYEQLPELKIILEQNFLQDEKERWYVPDLDRQADLEKLRTNALIYEFASYLISHGRLSLFRTEAVRAGFSKAWKERQYDLIVLVAERLPEQAFQNDANLKMYYDNALGRAGRQPYQEALL